MDRFAIGNSELLRGATLCPRIGTVQDYVIGEYPQITYYWTDLLILDHLYLVGNLTNSKIAETKALEPLKC